MVLFKRKPVQYLSKPPIQDDDAEIWVIPETNEVLLDYEAYLHRMDFLKQKRFICEITGHSGLNFFDAQKSEAIGSQEVDSSFPEALREPVLRRVQFSTTSRIDNLVDQVFDDFRQDFYPGETVTVVLDDGNRLNGLVREKAKFPALHRRDGSLERKAFSRYFVRLMTQSDEEALVDDDHIVRDRKAFTKQMLRSFIKNTVTREAWTGAPWLVKPEIAVKYFIDTTVPPHLQYGSKAAERKANAAAKKGEQEGMHHFWASRGLPELKPAIKGPKSKMSPEELANMKNDQFQEYQRALQGHPTFVLPKATQSTFDMHQYVPTNGTPYSPLPQLVPKSFPKPPPPPPIKYPIEDLEVAPVRDGTHRPAIKYLSQDTPMSASSQPDTPILMSTVGSLLETWNTLNVYCQVFMLDSFTFDDFVEAMQFSSTDVDCELFNEIHCAVLKKLVNGENDQNGAIQISLPDLPSDDEEQEDDSNLDGSGVAPTPTPEPEEPVKRMTRSSLNKAEVKPSPRSRSATADVRIHRAAEMFGEYGWIERLRKRDFRNGGWQLIMVGLLHQLAGRPRVQADCDEILTHLAPLDAEPTQQTAWLQYSTMDINMRVKALQIICMLTLETKAVKAFLEESSAQMTELRKTKIEHQRARKEAMAQLKVYHDERRRLQPEKSPTPPPELVEPPEVEMEEEDTSIMDTEDEEPQSNRALRRGNDRAVERKRKREEGEERKLKAIEAKQTKGTKDYQKVLKKVEQTQGKIRKEEDAIISVDNDLREADCPRTRVLGKDRFWNRYYWFERNAMPYEGLPDASTADAGYANARLWVQGPDDLEREGFIDVSPEENQRYFRTFQMTPAERKRSEEGPTSVFTAKQWGYYENPEDIDMLIGWLDTRGHREIKLRKELSSQREIIARYMEKRKEYLAKSSESEQDPDLQPPPPPTTRMSTRTKPHVNHGHRNSMTQSRCLRWRNEMALRELGHKHMDPPVLKTKSGRTIHNKKGTAVSSGGGSTSHAMPLSGEDGAGKNGVGMVTRNRTGKVLGRQGGRYNF